MTVSKLPRPICKVGSTALRVCPTLSRTDFPLQALQKEVPWLQHARSGTSMGLSGICKLLIRLGVCYKRGRAQVHSPDLLYNKKIAYIRSLRELNTTDQCAIYAFMKMN